MIEYVTKKGTEVKIELENSIVKNLIVNNIEIVKGGGKRDMAVFVTTFDNTIVLNDSCAYSKLGARQVIRIEASSELMEEYIKQTEERIRLKNEKEDMIEKKFRKNRKPYYDFDMHMNDVNQF